MRSLFALALVAACQSAAPAPVALSHEAYVWQRAWIAPVREAVIEAPPELDGLRVQLVASLGDQWVDQVDAGALAASHRPVTAVVRIEGSRPIDGYSLAPALATLDRWRAKGVDIAGLEIDHDCATAGLRDYALWLQRMRPTGYRWSITALPAWVDSPELLRVAAVVDELVLQVHAVKKPSLFSRAQAHRWVDQFADAIAGHPFRVAVPTYRVVVDGAPLAADPVEVAAFVRELAASPPSGLRGIVWFRLPVTSDRATWSIATLRAAIAGDPLVADVHAKFVERGPGVFDIVLENTGTLDGRAPPLSIEGPHDLIDPDRIVPAGTEVVIGWKGTR